MGRTYINCCDTGENIDVTDMSLEYVIAKLKQLVFERNCDCVLKSETGQDVSIFNVVAVSNSSSQHRQEERSREIIKKWDNLPLLDKFEMLHRAGLAKANMVGFGKSQITMYLGKDWDKIPTVDRTKIIAEMRKAGWL